MKLFGSVNWLTSVWKWRKALRLAKRGKLTDIYFREQIFRKCGYCREYKECGNCPLYKRKLCYGVEGVRRGSECIFWQIRYSIGRNDKTQVKELVSTMLKGIMKTKF